ncbi:class I adenylate-forming enzyme family protein [[Mycobacterium] vasticus]|nr:class I adenylate-forming enzyme family protein [Mycolicibacter sp. MYC017]
MSIPDTRFAVARPPDFLTLLDAADTTSIAVEDTDRSIGTADLALSVRALAGALAGHGVAQGDRVAVMLANSAACVELYLACALVGAIWVGINPTAPPAERDRQCALVSPVATITEGAPASGRVIDVASLVECGARPLDVQAPDLTVPCAIGFSSGTTGTPKALVHSRAGVSLAAAGLAEVNLRGDDRVGVILPMSIHNLMVTGVMATLFAGATCVTLDRMNAAGVAAACRDRGLTMLSALVPATIYDLVHDAAISPGALRSLRFAGCGAAGLSEELRSAFEAKFGVRLIGSYGMTEAPGVVTIERAGTAHCAGSSGTPLSHLRVTTCDECGEPLPEGREGELVVSAVEDGTWADLYRPAIGSWTTHGLVHRVADEKSFRTGDYGEVGEGGEVHVTGRRADVIVRGGVNVNGAELENLLGALPGIREIAVVGEPDERLGQRIVAFVELSPGTSMDLAQLRQQARNLLAHSKVPDEFVIGVLPRNAMGKVARTQLKHSDPSNGAIRGTT